MKIDKRELILNSAEQLMLSETGDNISMNMIAQQAGIAKGGIYYYYKSKEEVLYAVIQRAYRRAVHEYLDTADSNIAGIDKIKMLFCVIIKKEFKDKQHNLLTALHINENTLIHNYMKLVAIQEISPLLEKILVQCKAENSINIELEPAEVAEMIVATLTFLLDGTIFDDKNAYSKLKMFSNVLDICLGAVPGTFSFIYDKI